MSFDFMKYDSVLPMAIWFDKNLKPLDIKLYAILRSIAGINGEMFAGNAYLAQVMNVSIPTVERSLRHLKEHGFIEIETNKEGIYWQRKIHISENFKKFLRSITDDVPPHQKRCTPPSQMMDIKKKGVKEEISKEEDLTSSDAKKIANHLFYKIRSTNPKFTEPDLKEWALQLQVMHNIDGREWDEITSMIDWCFKDKFWFRVVLSPDKLRGNWDKIASQKLPSNPVMSENAKRNKENFDRFKEGLRSRGLHHHLELKGKYIIAKGKDYSLEMNPYELWRGICETFGISYVPPDEASA